LHHHCPGCRCFEHQEVPSVESASA
jgi:hypothetical protein